MCSGENPGAVRLEAGGWRRGGQDQEDIQEQRHSCQQVRRQN